MEDRTLIFKTVIVGDGAVGKTSLVNRFTEQKFNQNYIMTIGSNFALKLIPSNVLSTSEQYYPDTRLQIWDLAGQPHFAAVRHAFYKGSSGVIYTFDVTRPETLENLRGWKSEVLKQVPEGAPSVLLGNKIDLEDQVQISREEGIEAAKELCSLGYFETSAKSGDNVNACFQQLARAIIEYQDDLDY